VSGISNPLLNIDNQAVISKIMQLFFIGLHVSIHLKAFYGVKSGKTEVGTLWYLNA